MISRVNGVKGKLRLDWKAYFDRFVEVHGEPVEHDGYLLFSDGWRYSSLRYSGPEYPPPSDKRRLRSYRRNYWEKMLAKLTKEAHEIRQQLNGLEDWNNCTSLPLQQRVLVPQEGKEKATWSDPVDMDLGMLRHQLDDLEYYMKECETQLATLQET
jgi:hypothetical protein